MTRRAVAVVALALLAAVPVRAAGAQGTDLPHGVIPAPASVRPDTGPPLILTDSSPVFVTARASAEVMRLGRLLATMLGPGAPRTPRRLVEGATLPLGAVLLRLDSTRTADGDEGYAVDVTDASAVLQARTPAGLFFAIQTFRQLLPVAVEHRASINRRLAVRPVHITDTPRFAWRGAMLDVSRHFLGVDDVKRYIDAMALYKLNRLHLHLSDDQGWRIEIKRYPRLTTHGGSTEVGGGPGGYYTQLQYREIVRYAAERFITVVPEIDMPGHTNAALASIPALNCNGRATERYTGIRVGFSTVCASNERIYPILERIIRELAAITPGPYLHIGGDEVEKLGHQAYLRFVERAERIVRRQGKRVIGWGEIAPARLDTSTIVQHWRSDARGPRDSIGLHAARGGSVILSPGFRTYLDMKYDSTTVLGLRWAGAFDVQHAYEWDPVTHLPDVPPAAVLGVEAPLWSETLEKREDFEFLAFPRLVAIAEVGWTAQASRQWADFRRRLGMHGPRLQAIGVNFYRSPQVEWAR